MINRDIHDKKILRATPDQAEALTEIAFAAKRYWDYPERWIELWAPILTITEPFLRENECYTVLLAGSPIAFYALSFQEEHANLEYFWVEPGYIGQGFGAELFRHALARCKELGARGLEIESDPNAQGFYERMGAKLAGHVVNEEDGWKRILPLLRMNL